MFQLAVTEVVVCWLLWCYPFLKRRFGGPKRESNVLAPQANRGLLLQAVGLFFAWLRVPDPGGPGLARMIAAMILAPTAAVFAWLAVRILGKQFRILAGLYPDHELVRTGPYAIVRNPIYTSLFLMLIATGLLMTRWPLLSLAAALFITGTEIRVRGEEGLLRERFGKEFEQYTRHVPAYLPFLR